MNIPYTHRTRPLYLSARRLSTSQVTIGIRREDPSRIWERRCPLTPDAVEVLVRQKGVRVLVQDCDRRVFGLGEFVKVCGGVFFLYI
jgi:alpha-aminoadipic semialdehyde synthase